MVSAQPGLILQVNGYLTHTIFLAPTVFLDNYSYYFYAHLMKGNSAEEILRAKESYKRLGATHEAKVCTHREHKKRLSVLKLKEVFQSCGQEISYCKMESHHLLRAVSRNWTQVVRPSFFMPPDCGRKLWVTFCGLSPSRQCTISTTTWIWTRTKRCWRRSFLVWNPKISYRLPHLGLPCLCHRRPTGLRAGKDTQMVSKGNYKSISLTLPIPHRVNALSIKH